ncbi:MAG TPA: glutamyl-tRNA reductase [Acidimicrobiales bacterium]|nr:glutamyl-tRNA reductase [Acidimicrobiales bacterium]
MSVVVVGLNHRTVPLSALEPMTVSPARLPKALHDLAAQENLSEVVVLSTCLRTEVYAVAHRFHTAMADIRNFLSAWSGRPPEAFVGQLYEYHDEAVAKHLFTVAAGLDSAVLGESEVLGQVGAAWDTAREHGAAGPVLSMLFRQALEVGKRVRSETAISRGTTSLSQAAVALAGEKLGSLSGLTTVVMGAGEMGEAMAQALAGALSEDGQLVVVNRTWGRATELAARCGGRALEWGSLPSALVQADVLLASTGSPQVLLEAADLEPLLASRAGRPLLIVDIAVPRDVDPSVGLLPGVTLLDMDDLSAFASKAMDSRRAEVPDAQAIVAEEVERYLGVAAQRQVAPLVAALHDKAEEVRKAEMDRFARRLAGLSPAQAQAVEALSRGIVAKILHDPTVELKTAAGGPAGEQLAQALRQLFDL